MNVRTAQRRLVTPKKPMTKFSATERKAVAVTFECIVAMFLQPKMINN